MKSTIKKHNKAIKDAHEGPWAGLALLRAVRPLLRRYESST